MACVLLICWTFPLEEVRPGIATGSFGKSRWKSALDSCRRSTQTQTSLYRNRCIAIDVLYFVIYFLVSIWFTASPQSPPHLKFHSTADWQTYDYYEFFAGVGNITRQARACGYKAIRFDIKDNQRPPKRRSNFMDLNSPSGFALLDLFQISLQKVFSGWHVLNELPNDNWFNAPQTSWYNHHFKNYDHIWYLP